LRATVTRPTKKKCLHNHRKSNLTKRNPTFVQRN
jgi:hypothetical protein